MDKDVFLVDIVEGEREGQGPFTILWNEKKKWKIHSRDVFHATDSGRLDLEQVHRHGPRQGRSKIANV